MVDFKEVRRTVFSEIQDSDLVVVNDVHVKKDAKKNIITEVSFNLSQFVAIS